MKKAFAEIALAVALATALLPVAVAYAESDYDRCYRNSINQGWSSSQAAKYCSKYSR